MHAGRMPKKEKKARAGAIRGEKARLKLKEKMRDRD